MRTKLDISAIAEQASQGYNPKEITKILGYKEASVRNALYKLGFRFPEQARVGGKIEDQKLEIIELFNQKKSPKQIAETLNLNQVSVSSLLNRHGFYYNPKIGNPDYFDTIDSTIKSYFLGFICADGAIVQNNSGSKVLTITIDVKDKIILEKLKSELRSTHNIQNINRVCNFNKDKIINHVRLVFSNKQINTALEKLGIVQRKTFILDNVIERIPLEFRDSFVIGYLDGDGCIVSPSTKKMTKKGISIHNNQSRIVTFKGTFTLLEGIAKHLNLEKYSLRKNKNQNIHTLTFSDRKEVSKIASCYNNTEFFLLRKFNKLQTSQLYQAQTISPS